MLFFAGSRQRWGSIPGLGTKVLHAKQCGKKKNLKNNMSKVWILTEKVKISHQEPLMQCQIFK